ncbi:response regulator transcription factor [uncultured Tateyamaria sp.]|uniref:response regulator transcription factor n=1 Tax=uncultured Tateyamaria sp. TaxID=455651 RepID=UPI0026165F24|nr:response regulator transcription factor [uncultured Tateyamaria sp.]
MNSTVAIADSHEIIREGIATRLCKHCNVEVVAETSDGYTTLKACRQHKPEILLMDLSLSRPSGAEILGKLRASNPEMKIVVLSSNPSSSNAFLALSSGAVGFMPKQAPGSDFVNAVRAAQNDYAYFPTDLLTHFVQSRRNLTRTGNIYGLSARELEILDACVSGQSTKEVASNLSISVRTVETHRNSIYKKTSCRSYKDLAQIVTMD